jgi:prepilin-type N-terminal cleavage/methylation domain-containing protein
MNIQSHYKKFAKGFTLIEVMVVIAIVGILSAVVYSTTSGSKADARYSLGEQQLTKYFPESLQRLLIRHNDCTILDKTEFVGTGIKTDNAFGNSWLVASVTATTATITYPMLSSADATSMAANVSGGFLINSVTPTAASLSIVYSCL